MIFDTHAHYDDKQFDADRAKLLLSVNQKTSGTDPIPGDNAGVCAIINVGATRQGCYDALRMAKEYPYVYAALGVHPDDVGTMDEAFLSWMEETACVEEKVVAIGEIGLDYHWDICSHDVQKNWFIRQLEVAKRLELPVQIHSRDVAQDTFAVMKEHGKGLRGTIHCFSYSPELAAEYVKLGFHIGIGGVLTFKNAKKLKQVAAQIPLERILLETDCPYLAPAPYRGKRNQSSYLYYVAKELAAQRGMTTEEVLRITEENARELFLS